MYGKGRVAGVPKESIVLFTLDSSGSYTVDCDFL